MISQRNKGRRSRPAPCLNIERLEDRQLLSRGPSPISTGDPFADVAADNPSAQIGHLYPGSQVEPYVVANPTRANDLVGIWQQDRWDNGGSRGIVVAVSDDRGDHWTPIVLPGVSKASGGVYDRVTDPWLSFAPDGTLYATTLAFSIAGPFPSPFNANGSTIQVSRSTDGGHTWSLPTSLIDTPNPNFGASGPELAFNDKESVTADPTRPGVAYVVWDQTDYNLISGDFVGPTYFARTTDGGQTWESARPIYTPDAGAQTLANQIVVLPDGTLVDMFSEGSLTGGRLAVIRSTDAGATWSAPISVSPAIAPPPIIDPDTGAEVRTADTIPDIAVDPHSGALYVVSQQLYVLPGGPFLPGINLFTSTDGGLSWSAPVQVDQSPAGVQAFDPSVAVAADGTVGVSYDDFRNNTPAPGLLTDAWLVTARPGDLSDPASWSHERRLTAQSFDLELAPDVEGDGSFGSFLGDYQGLTSQGNQFLTFFTVAGTNGDGTSAIFFDRVNPGDSVTSPGHGVQSLPDAAPAWLLAWFQGNRKAKAHR